MDFDELVQPARVAWGQMAYDLGEVRERLARAERERDLALTERDMAEDALAQHMATHERVLYEMPTDLPNETRITEKTAAKAGWEAPHWEPFRKNVQVRDGRLRIHLTPGMAGTDGGLGMPLALPERVKRARLSCKVKMSPDFDAGQIPGGKLIGLIATAPGVSPTDASGGRGERPRANSLRMMWGGGRRSRPFAAFGYAYDSDMQRAPDPKTGKVYGDDLMTPFDFRPGVEHSLDIETDQGSPDKADGLTRIDFDGQLGHLDERYSWRSDPDVLTSHWYLAAWRGGDKSWAGRRPSWVEYWDIRITALG